MPLEPLAPSTLLTFAALLGSVIAIWLPYRFAWAVLLTLAVILGYGAGVLSGPAFIPIAGLALACWLYRYRAQQVSAVFPGARVLLAVAIVFVSLLLGFHVFPGFHNPVYVNALVFSPGAAPYTRSLTFDTWVVGVLLLGLCYEVILRTRREWIEALKRAWPVIVINMIVLVPLAVMLGFVRFDPKWTNYYLVWAVIYLFFVIMTEEAFFRGFIQKELAGAMSKYRAGAWVALGVTALLFGLSHFDGGIAYVVLASVAGVGYGLAFLRSGRIEMSILAHFGVNSMRFLLFTYPYLG